MPPSTTPPAKTPSIKDVARLAQVSVGTVSNVLNGRGFVRNEVRQRVEAAIDSLGYVPNPTAQALRRGVSPLVGVAVYDLTNPFFMEAASGMERRLAADGCVMALSSTKSSPTTEATLLRALMGQAVRGILLTPSDPELSAAREVVQRGIPIVLFDSPAQPEDMSSISVDDRTGASLAIQHLMSLGHTNIMFFNGPASIRQAQDRLHGAEDALGAALAMQAHRSSGDEPAPQLHTLNLPAFTAEAGRTTMCALLEKEGIPTPVAHDNASLPGRPTTPPALPNSFPTAFFCANDLIAFGAMTMLRDAGIRVPDDVSIVGFDDIAIAAQMSVPLTTVRQPMEELGWAAADLLLGDKTGKPRIQHLKFFPTLVTRASTAAPRHTS